MIDDDAVASVGIAAELQASRRRLERMAASSPTALRLARLLGRLDARLSRPPRIVLLGEFNAGKTTLANALLGADVLPTSIHANTRLPLHVRWSPRPALALEIADRTRHALTEATLHMLGNGQGRMLHVGLPVERLKRFELIDTPGLASGMSRLEGGNVEACNRANLAIWCTASTQAWKATERSAWEAVPERLRRRSLLIATLADTLNTDRDRGRVEARLRNEAGKLFSGVAMVAAAEIDELRRHPELPDHAERWKSSGGAVLDELVDTCIGREIASREAATGRMLSRVATRLAGPTETAPAQAA